MTRIFVTVPSVLVLMVIYELCAVLWMRGTACGVWDGVCGIAGAWAPEQGIT